MHHMYRVDLLSEKAAYPSIGLSNMAHMYRIDILSEKAGYPSRVCRTSYVLGAYRTILRRN
eukprot:177085-Amorphochlora_amoeboformis.AAC.1